MADWYGSARSNYVKVADKEGLVKSLAPFPIQISEGKDETVCLLSDDQFGGWPSFVWDPDEGTELEFDPEMHVMPYLAEDSVLVLQEVGAEKLRYLTGKAEAFVRTADGIKSCFVSIDNIYTEAAKCFGVSEASISEASY